MFGVCDYTEERDRKRLYWDSWLLQARFWRTIGPGGMDATMGVKNAYRVDERYNMQDATMIEGLSDLLRKKHYNY